MNPTLTTLLDDIGAKAKEIDSWEMTKDLSLAEERFEKYSAVINAPTTLALVSALRVAMEALEKCNDKCSDYSCGSVTQKALTHLDELFEKEK